MRPLEALAQLSCPRGHRPAAADPVCVCGACRDALLRDLATLFAPVPADQAPLTLEGSCIMGCTFSEGPEEACVLHALLQTEETS